MCYNVFYSILFSIARAHAQAFAKENAIVETVRSGSLATRILIFILAMLLGMAILVGAVAGALYAAFAWVSLDRLQGLGIGINTDGFLEEDSPLRTLSLLGIIAEFSKISADLSSASMASLAENYGVILPEAMFAFVPEEMMEIPLSDYRDKGVLNVFLSTATVGHALALAGQDVLPEAARVKMEDRTLNLLVEQKLDLLFEGVYAGDLMGIAVEKGSDGVVEPVLGDDEEATISSYLATLDIGEYFAAEDRNAVLQATLDRTPMSVLIEGSGGNPVYNAMVDKYLGEVLKLEQGGFYFQLDNALEGLCLGDTLGYEKTDDGVWQDADGNPAKGLYAELAPLKINELADTNLMGIVEDMYVGELMELEQGEMTSSATETADAKYEWSDEGSAITGLRLSFANLKVGVLMNDTLNADTLALNEHPLYEVLGYEKKTDGKWYDTAGNPVSGSLSALMEIKVGDLSTGVDTLYVGELMGYTIRKDKNGNFLDKNNNVVFKRDDGSFEDENGNLIPEGDAPVFRNDEDKEPTGVSASIVSMQVADLDDQLNDKINATKVGDAMGYYYKPDAEKTDDPENDLYYGVWYKDSAYSTKVTGVFSTLSNYKVNEMDGAVKKVTVADALGYTKETKDGVTHWYTGEGENKKEATGIFRLLMENKLDDLTERSQTIYLGEIMGFDAYDKTTGEPATKDTATANLVFKKSDGTVPGTLMGAFADMKVSQLENESNFTTRVKGIRVGDAMGYVEKNGKWYVEYVSDTDDTKNTPVSNKLLVSVIGNTVGEMDGVLENLTLAQVMGYYYKPSSDPEKVDVPAEHKYYGTWYTDEGRTNKVTGFMGLLNLGRPINEIDQEINDMKANATIQDYMDAGILDLSGSETTLTDYFNMLHAADSEVSADWQGYKLDGFIDAIIGGLDTIVGGS